MITKQNGNVIILSLAVALVITVGGLITLRGLSKNVDHKTIYVQRSDGKLSLIKRIQNLENFRDEWLQSLRTQNFSRSWIRRCIPEQNDTAPQNFSGCNGGQRLATQADLFKAYQESSKTLTTITGNSFAFTLPLVDETDRNLSGTTTNPILYDVTGSPCQTNCHFSVISYMIKQQNPGNPGDVIFAFRIREINKPELSFTTKDDWVFIPLQTVYWNNMFIVDADSTTLCPAGSFAVKVLPNARVVCRDFHMECIDGEYLAGFSPNGEALCRPLPTFVEPLSSTEFNCDSWGFRRSSCPYPIPDPNASVKSISVNYKRSKSSCSLGYSYMYYPSPSQVVVDHGCRAKFNLELACNMDFYLEPRANFCSPVGVGRYSPALNNESFACTNKPSDAHYTGSGRGENKCPWECDPGFVLDGVSCMPPPKPTPSPTPGP